LEGGLRDRGGSVYKAGSESLMTHVEVAGGCVKQIWLVSGWAKGWQVKTKYIEIKIIIRTLSMVYVNCSNYEFNTNRLTLTLLTWSIW